MHAIRQQRAARSAFFTAVLLL